MHLIWYDETYHFIIQILEHRLPGEMCVCVCCMYGGEGGKISLQYYSSKKRKSCTFPSNSIENISALPFSSSCSLYSRYTVARLLNFLNAEHSPRKWGIVPMCALVLHCPAIWLQFIYPYFHLVYIFFWLAIQSLSIFSTLIDNIVPNFKRFFCGMFVICKAIFKLAIFITLLDNTPYLPSSFSLTLGLCLFGTKKVRKSKSEINAKPEQICNITNETMQSGYNFIEWINEH